MDTTLSPGEVALVGGGPGDPDLLTLAAWRMLEQADVILHDRLGPVSALDRLPHSPELVPVGKIPRGDFTPQERINELLVQYAKAGKRVVRLKGGDSYVFGRGGEEWLACIAAGVPVRVIPGGDILRRGSCARWGAGDPSRRHARIHRRQRSCSAQ